jgi:hypothetical protein
MPALSSVVPSSLVGQLRSQLQVGPCSTALVMKSWSCCRPPALKHPKTFAAGRQPVKRYIPSSNAAAAPVARHAAQLATRLGVPVG